MFCAPPTAHVSKEAMSSILIFGISSCSVESGLSAGRVTISGLVVGNGTGVGAEVGAGVGAGSGWTPTDYRRARNSFSSFSILVLKSTMHQITFALDAISGCCPY